MGQVFVALEEVAKAMEDKLGYGLNIITPYMLEVPVTLFVPEKFSIIEVVYESEESGLFVYNKHGVLLDPNSFDVISGKLIENNMVNIETVKKYIRMVKLSEEDLNCVSC